MTIKTCAEGTELEVFGVDTGGCQTKEVLERAIGLPDSAGKRYDPQRVQLRAGKRHRGV